MLFFHFYTLISTLVTVNTIYAFYFFLLDHCTNSLLSLHIFVHHCTFCASLHVRTSPDFNNYYTSLVHMHFRMCHWYTCTFVYASLARMHFDIRILYTCTYSFTRESLTFLYFYLRLWYSCTFTYSISLKHVHIVIAL